MFDSVTKIKYFLKKNGSFNEKEFFCLLWVQIHTDRCFLAFFLGNIKKPGVHSLWPPLMHFLKYLEYATYIKCFRAIVVSTFYNLLLHLYLFPIKIPMSYYYFTKGLQTNKKIMVQGYGSLVQVYSKKITSTRSILISA